MHPYCVQECNMSNIVHSSNPADLRGFVEPYQNIVRKITTNMVQGQTNCSLACVPCTRKFTASSPVSTGIGRYINA